MNTQIHEYAILHFYILKASHILSIHCVHTCMLSFLCIQLEMSCGFFGLEAINDLLLSLSLYLLSPLLNLSPFLACSLMLSPSYSIGPIYFFIVLRHRTHHTTMHSRLCFRCFFRLLFRIRKISAHKHMFLLLYNTFCKNRNDCGS